MNRTYKALAFFILLFCGQLAIAQNFITQWNLATAGSGATQLSFGTATSGVVNYTWQEISPGSASGSGSWSGSSLTITGLPVGAIIRLQIAPTNFQRININNGSDRNRLTLVEQWGSTAWTDMTGAFYGCANLQVTATDVPNLLGVTNMAAMFWGCTNLNSPANINTWNTAAVTNMSSMFFQANAFNQNIGAWNTAAVTTMQQMFYRASAFNQNIGSWNTGAVTNMAVMFNEATAFNQNIGAWNTGSVTLMSFMFADAIAFNQNISSWNTAAVTGMNTMFSGASAFNQNIGAWVLNSGVNMSFMLENSGMDCNNYSSTLEGWNANPLTPNGRTLGATGRQYGTNAVAARTNLTTTKGWTITGDSPSGTDCSSAPMPTITSFTPISGPIGTTVIITGTNFSTTPTNNIVTFNGTTAVVSASSATSITTIVPVGATTGTIAVTVAGNTATSATPFTVAPFHLAFQSTLNLTVGSTPREVVVGDIDEDGHQDLIASNFGSGSISFLKGIGNGCFESAQNFNTGANSHGLALADFNQDMKLDLAVSKGAINTSSLGVLLGNGTPFAAQTNYTTSPVPKSPNHINTGDMNSDGWLDIVAANQNPIGSFSILYNNGDGTFATGVDFSSANGSAYFIATGNINGDTHLDIAIASIFVGAASVYISDGLGGFLPETTYSSAAGSHYVVLRDLNSDNRPEMIVANATANSISVFLNNGFGSYLAPVIYPTENYPTTISIADMDSDGKLDMVVGNVGSGTVTAFPGDGAGGFGAYKSFAVGGAPYSVATGDFDEDGNLDIAAVDLSSNKVNVLLSTLNTCIPSIVNFTPTSGPVGTPVTITGTIFSPTPANNVVNFNGTLAVATASTITSITTTVPALATTGPITVTVSGNTATSSGDFTVTICPDAPTGVHNSGCQNTTITLTASGGANGQYRWYTVATGGTHDAAQTNDTYTTPNLTTTTSYFVSINDGACESARTEVIATVIPLPSPPGVQPVNPVCPGSDVTLTATGGTDGQYRWYDGATLLASVNSTYEATNISFNKTFQVSIYDGTCESNKTSVTVTVQNCTPPVVAPTTSTAFIEGLVIIELQELISDPEDNIDPSRITITAQPASGAFAELAGFELRINYAGSPFVGSDQVGIEVCDFTDLCTVQTIGIELFGTITVFNALSPNGDEKNDAFIIQYVDILPETLDNKVYIYNRWGDVVWETDNYDNVNRVFKGLTVDGKELPSGTYYYKLSFSGTSKTGFINLKR